MRRRLPRVVAVAAPHGPFSRAADAISAVGFILACGAAMTVLPLLWLPLAPSEVTYAPAFIAPALIEALLAALLIAATTRSRQHHLTMQQGAVAVVVGWIAVMACSAWPIARSTGLGWMPALFEAVSGWTTTGLTVVDVAAAPRILLLWRSTMQLAGGAGLAMLMVAVVGSSGAAGPYTAESRGDQAVHHVGSSARLVIALCGIYAGAGTIAYAAAGMSWFEALNHAFAAVSTGGFSTHPQGIGHWDSPAIEAITLVLMVLGSLNFLTVWLLARRRAPSAGAAAELKALAVILPAGALLLFLLAVRAAYPALGKAARVAIFESVSALTTGGFSTASYSGWPRGAWLVLIGLMVVGGGSCSTAGGIKLLRVYELARTAMCEIRRASLPRTAVVGWRASGGAGSPSEAELRQTGIFFFVYISVLAVGTIVLAAQGIPLDQALFEFASALGTVGLSVGATRASVPPAVLWTQMAGMLLGRLELFVVFAALAESLRGFSRLAASALTRRAA